MEEFSRVPTTESVFPECSQPLSVGCKGFAPVGHMAICVPGVRIE